MTHRSRSGAFVDWVTQRWVQVTGRRVTWAEHPWLAGPVGDVDVIGTDFFRRWAERHGLRLIEGGEPRGLLPNFAALQLAEHGFPPVTPEIARFYERTSEYEFDVWSEWSGVFQPFGRALAWIFSRRLEQLNMPLSPLDMKLGITSAVLRLAASSRADDLAAWVRTAVATGRTLYVGSYSTARLPGLDRPCVKVVFPLPNGYALVAMRPEVNPDGSLTLWSQGARFGDPGFYFYVEDEPGHGWSRRLARFTESIRVFVDGSGELRTDHEFRLFGVCFLRLHYRMRRKPESQRVE